MKEEEGSEGGDGKVILVGELLGHLLARELLEHAARTVGDLLVHPALFRRVDLALAEFLLDGIETCKSVSRGVPWLGSSSRRQKGGVGE